MELTKLELKVLKAIDNSEYCCDGLDGDIWLFSATDHAVRLGLKSKTSMGGIITSLRKKGLVRLGGVGREATIGMTVDGMKAYIAAVGCNNVKKPIPEAVL